MSTRESAFLCVFVHSRFFWAGWRALSLAESIGETKVMRDTMGTHMRKCKRNCFALLQFS